LKVGLPAKIKPIDPIRALAPGTVPHQAKVVFHSLPPLIVVQNPATLARPIVSPESHGTPPESYGALLESHGTPRESHVTPLKWHVTPRESHVTPLKWHVTPRESHVTPLK
jgi:hypothetical protein